MPLTEEEWERLKEGVERMFGDVARDLDAIAIEAQAIQRVPQRGDVPGDLGVALESGAETVAARIAAIRRRLTLFGRDIDDLRTAEDL